MPADPQTSDAQATQNFIDWYLDPLARTVGVDPAFGAFPLHLKHDDDFSWRLHVKVGAVSSTNPIMQLAGLTEIKFVMLEKGRYDGSPLATGVSDGTWDETNGCYTMAISLNGPALNAYLATLDATSTGFPTGGFDCTSASAKAAGTSTTTTVTGTGADTTTTATTAPGTPAPSALPDYEFMGEFRLVQNGKMMRTQTFSIFVARDIITSAPAAVVIAPPPAPTDWRFLTTMASEGTPYANELFGYFRAPLQLEVLGLQIAIQQPDAAQGFRVQLTDNAGNELGDPAGSQYFGDVAAGARFAYLVFGQVLPLNQGTEICAKIKNYAGNDAAGVVVNLICRQYLTNSPAGPSGPPGITAATATTLAAGAPATASLVGQVITIGVPQGIQGDKGVDGTNIATIQVTTLAPGSQATAQLTGTTLNLGIPQGTPGNNGTSVTGVQLTMLPTGSQSTAVFNNGTIFFKIASPTNGTNGIDGTDGTNGTNIATVAVTMVAAGTNPTGNVQGTTLNLSIPYPAVQGSVTRAQNFGDVQYTAAQDLVASFTFNGTGRVALVTASFTNSDNVTNDQVRFSATLERVAAGTISQIATSNGTGNHTGSGNTSPVSFMQVDSNGSTPNGPITYNLRVQGFTAGGARQSATAQSICLAVTEL